ncbi:MAG: hypothetical protein AB1627_12620 [Chloroflexota bacterium]
MPRRTLRLLAVPLFVAAALVALGVAGMGARPTPPTTVFAASHVSVTISVSGQGTTRVLEARLEPDEPGLHLYGPDLPADGIDGAGRPTWIEPVSGGWTAVAGPPVAAPTPFATALPGFSAPFSVLPDGPVTIRLPIEHADGDASILRIAITYMACTTAGRCYPPVVGHELDVVVP